jgi:hypothetical protein
MLHTNVFHRIFARFSEADSLSGQELALEGAKGTVISLDVAKASNRKQVKNITLRRDKVLQRSGTHGENAFL